MRRGAVASTIGRVVGLLALGALAACAASAPPADTVVYASGADLESGNPLVTIHPLARQVQRYMLFVTLARYDSALEPEPYYARSWTWSPDRRALTFALLRGLAWDDGRPTTSHDVAFTIDAARAPRTGYPRYADLANVASVDTPNDTAVVIHFSRPQPAFPLVLCELPIVPEHVLGRVAPGDMRRAPFDTAPVGNGPYRFAGRRPNERWVFVRNDAFPAVLGGPPRIRRFVVAIVDEASTKFAGLVSGELDVAGIAPSMASLAARDRSLRVIDYPVLMSNGIIFNVSRPPFDDARVRRAVGLALDRRRIVAAALAGYATPAAGPVPAAHPDAAPADVNADTARADSLLDAAGWRRRADGARARNGIPLGMELLTVGSGDNAVEQLLQSDLAAVGPTVYVEALLDGMPPELRGFAVASIEELDAADDLGALAHTPGFGLVRALAIEAYYSDFVAPGHDAPGAYAEIDFNTPLATRIRKDWSFMGIA